ncbi:MAG: PTS sugar transporter subunit IIA [Candidatus Hydrogenedentes bacterium]|nr:PTS sugar transporter subunit IIA [Candidatus Hydrogenedentota bacterium]
MRLGELLHEDVVKLHLQASTKQEAIEELVDVLIDAHEIPFSMRSHILEVITEREDQASTGMEHGVAIPHGASDRIEDTIAALGISPEGIPFNSLDGVSARIVVLLITPRRNYQGQVATLGGIAHLFQNAKLREQLRAAPDTDSVLRVIRWEESKGGVPSM